MNQLISGMNDFLGLLPLYFITCVIVYIICYCVRRFRSPFWLLAHREATRLRKKRHGLLIQRREERNAARAASGLPRDVPYQDWRRR